MRWGSLLVWVCEKSLEKVGRISPKGWSDGLKMAEEQNFVGSIGWGKSVWKAFLCCLVQLLIRMPQLETCWKGEVMEVSCWCSLESPSRIRKWRCFLIYGGYLYSKSAKHRRRVEAIWDLFYSLFCRLWLLKPLLGLFWCFFRLIGTWFAGLRVW